jgi:hypothetical protein
VEVEATVEAATDDEIAAEEQRLMSDGPNAEEPPL